MKTSTSRFIRIIALIVIAFYFISAYAQSRTLPSLNLVPAVYTVTGGGAGCQIAHVAVGLSNSEVGVSYALLKNNEWHEAKVGSGFALSFGNHEVGTYTVTATNTEGTIAMTGNAVITEIPSISASVAIVASANPVQNGVMVTFTPTSVGGGTTPTYQWYKNSMLVASGVTYSYIPANNDVVHVIMTSNATPCVSGNPATSNSISMLVGSTTGVDNKKVMPNIYTVEKNIVVVYPEAIKYINIYNAAGILVKTVADVNQTYKISMIDQPQGCYIVSLVSNENVYSRKVNLK